MPLRDGAASKVSVHSALWAKQWGTDLASHIERASSLGYDGVEVSLLGIELSNPASLAATARDVGVELKCTTGLSVNHDVSSVDASIRSAGVDHLRRCADVVATLDADLLAGVIYAPWGVFGSPESRRTGSVGPPSHWAMSRQNLRIEGSRSVSKRSIDLKPISSTPPLKQPSWPT